MFRLVMIAVTLVITGMATAHGQSYPSKPVRLVLPFAPATGGDIIARVVARKLTELLGQQVIVDNRAGAGSVIGTELVAKSPPDGLTIMIQANPMAANHTLYPKLPYDTFKDFAPVVFIGSTPNVLVAHPSFPARSPADVVALAKRRPNEITYASSGAGSASYLAAEMFKQLTGVRIVHVPFRGTPPALVAVMSGEVQLMVASLPTSVSFIKDGKLRAMGVTGAKRTSFFPALATLAETGIKGFSFETWYGVFVPSGVPQNVVMLLNTSINKIIAMPDIKEELNRAGVETSGGTIEAFAKYFQDEVDRLGKVIRESGAKPE